MQAHLEESVARHKQHIARMEQLLRLLDNEAVEPDDPELLNVKEMMEDYLDRNQEDFDSFDVSCAEHALRGGRPAQCGDFLVVGDEMAVLLPLSEHSRDLSFVSVLQVLWLTRKGWLVSVAARQSHLTEPVRLGCPATSSWRPLLRLAQHQSQLHCLCLQTPDDLYGDLLEQLEEVANAQPLTTALHVKGKDPKVRNTAQAASTLQHVVPAHPQLAEWVPPEI